MVFLDFARHQIIEQRDGQIRHFFLIFLRGA
jgi:hypothetical protein